MLIIGHVYRFLLIFLSTFIDIISFYAIILVIGNVDRMLNLASFSVTVIILNYSDISIVSIGTVV